LSPVLTAALFLSGRLTFIVAGISVAYVIGSHLGNPFFPTQFSLPEVSFFMVYMIAISLAAVLPYIINANLRQRLQAESVLSERQRISREIHDGVAQTLTMLRWRVQLLQRRLLDTGVGLEEVIQLERLAEKAQYDAREALELLHNNSYDGCFLPHLRDYMEHLERDTGINVSLDTGPDSVNLDTVVEIELLRICQEALTNIRKHSKASNVQVKLKTVNGYLQVTISDDGGGFDVLVASPDIVTTKGYGLSVMQERAESVGGKILIKSIPGHGTEVQVEVPSDPHGVRVLWQRV
jgi:signal transduction histidine kinase